MTYLFMFALGFLAAVVLEQMAPGIFGKIKMAGAAIVAAIAGFWDQIQGWLS